MPPQTFNLKLEYRIFAAIKRMNKYNRNKICILQIIQQNVVPLHRDKTKRKINPPTEYKMTRVIKFTKMHGAGNDYIYVNTLKYPIESPEKLSVEWSAPHTGIGVFR